MIKVGNMGSPIARNREQALLNLLGTTEIPDPRDYPAQLTLPDSIQARRNRIVAATDEDMHIRTSTYRYRFGQWYGGLVLRGTKPYPDTKTGSIVASTGLMASLIGQLYRPHLFLVAHQSFGSEKITSAIRAMEEEHKDFKPVPTPQKQSTATYMLPGLDEVKLMQQNIGGTLGMMVASVEGTFLSVRHDMDSTSFFEPEVVQQARMNYADQIISMANRETENLPREETRDRVLGAVVLALQNKYVCYFSEEPQASLVERVNAVGM